MYLQKTPQWLVTRSKSTLVLTKILNLNSILTRLSPYSRQTWSRNLESFNILSMLHKTSNVPTEINNFNLAYKSAPINLNLSTLTPMKETINMYNKSSRASELKWLSPLIKWTFFSNTKRITPHFSFRAIAIMDSGGGLNIVSMRKVLIYWSKVFRLLLSIFYYNIKTTAFGSTFFKKELNTFNWESIPTSYALWKYVRPFFTLHRTRINVINYKLFFLLKTLGSYTAIITDVNYHTRTLFYLKSNHFYSVGMVPININKSIVDFAIPFTGDNLLIQLLFIRFLFFSKSESKRLKFNSLVKNLNSNN